ncbi:nitrilase-related carbon-nitrogen hydrolase [Roseibium limicola]|uniref:Nitrilase n=1 Tax=Roseibium limicola TaxID=2816037 RepID=A0A939EPC7_9HYPH|nr:nitrilase-related carbon-nitrogen hydrolase [Roseibium limicola]MBO0344659.1 nitrilase [Roseibium limicola]
MSDVPIALWAMNLGFSPRSAEAFANHVKSKMLEVKEEGGKLLVLPEFAIEACLAFKPEGLKPTEEMAFLASVGEEVRALLQPVPEETGVSLLLGSMPIVCEGGLTNTAVFYAADGREIRHDKLSLTPGEMDETTWNLVPGPAIRVFEWEGIKTAILICLDVEMPALSVMLAEHKIELLLIPSMTEKLSGYHRVFDCAKARAVELMCAVGVCGAVGASVGTTQMHTNVSGAALFVPCEEPLGFTGVGSKTPTTDGCAGESPVLFATVPVTIIRELRSGDAEVWPGAWKADHVQVLVED